MSTPAPLTPSAAQDFMKDITSFDRHLIQLTLELKGMEVKGYTEEGEPILETVGNQRMSNEMIRETISGIRSFLTTNTSFANIKEGRFNRILWDEANAYAIRLWEQMVRGKAGVDKSDYRLICSQVKTIKELALSKAVDGNFQLFASSTKSTIENKIIETKEGGGVLSGIRWGTPQKTI